MIEKQQISIREATPADAGIIHRLAHETWWPTYQDFLSHDQIENMLEEMYSVESLIVQMQGGCCFLLLYSDQEPIGFAGIRILQTEGLQTALLRIDKLYIHPSAQGSGGGSMLLHEIYKQAKAAKADLIELNVNRHNSAFHFYERQGFAVHQEIDIPYGRFVLNDFVMRKHLAPA